MKFLPFVIKSAARNPLRAALTLLGVAVAVFIFTAILAIDRGMHRMVEQSGGPNPDRDGCSVGCGPPIRPNLDYRMESAGKNGIPSSYFSVPGLAISRIW